MSQLVDNLIAFRILSMLVTPFDKTKSYEMGIIDKNGNALKKLKDMTNTQKDHYSMLHRMVFRLKKIMSKIPLVNTQLGTLATAYFLVKECTNRGSIPPTLEEDFLDLLKKIQKEDIVLVEEYLLVEEFLQTINEEMPANVTGAAVKTDEPVIRKRKFTKFSVTAPVYSRMSKGIKSTRLKEQFGIGDVEDDIYEFVRKNPGVVVMLENKESGESKVLKFATKQNNMWSRVKRT
jgi:hypothetical protein